MGVSASTLGQLVTEEFNRLANNNQYLILDEILQFRVDLGLNIDLESVALLFDLDRRAPRCSPPFNGGASCVLGAHLHIDATHTCVVSGTGWVCHHLFLHRQQ
jgi:hypothetical protein